MTNPERARGPIARWALLLPPAVAAGLPLPRPALLLLHVIPEHHETMPLDYVLAQLESAARQAAASRSAASVSLLDGMQHGRFDYPGSTGGSTRDFGHGTAEAR